MNIFFDILLAHPEFKNFPEIKYFDMMSDFISNGMESLKDRINFEESIEPRAHLLVKILDQNEPGLAFSTVGYSRELSILIQTITHSLDFTRFDDIIGDLHQAINN